MTAVAGRLPSQRFARKFRMCFATSISSIRAGSIYAHRACRLKIHTEKGDACCAEPFERLGQPGIFKEILLGVMFLLFQVGSE